MIKIFNKINPPILKIYYIFVQHSYIVTNTLKNPIYNFAAILTHVITKRSFTLRTNCPLHTRHLLPLPPHLTLHATEN